MAAIDPSRVIWTTTPFPRPLEGRPPSVNQRSLSGPTVSADAPEKLGTAENSVITPAGVIRPTASGPSVVNQRFPSGAAVSADVLEWWSGNPETAPAGVIRSIPKSPSGNQRLLSGPTVSAAVAAVLPFEPSG